MLDQTLAATLSSREVHEQPVHMANLCKQQSTQS